MNEVHKTEAPVAGNAGLPRTSAVNFFTDVSPNQPRYIENGISRDPYDSPYMKAPALELFCSHPKCNGTRIFRAEYNVRCANKDNDVFATYKCSNCNVNEKKYSLNVQRIDKSMDCIITKYGEIPLFGPPLSNRLASLFGSDRELFLKGFKSENQGLGIGAFSYYRRVIENQKNRIFDEIISVAKTFNEDANLISELEEAKKENQFTKSIERIKHALPQALLVKGHNPLTLLHQVLSDGIHDRNDEECLELATSIRVLLTELLEKIEQTLKDKDQVNKALSALLNKQKEKIEKKKTA